MKEKVSKKFNELYGEGAILFASPGRINLIGEHTDYNGGFVFPGAVDKGIVAAIRLNGCKIEFPCKLIDLMQTSNYKSGSVNTKIPPTGENEFWAVTLTNGKGERIEATLFNPTAQELDEADCLVNSISIGPRSDNWHNISDFAVFGLKSKTATREEVVQAIEKYCGAPAYVIETPNADYYQFYDKKPTVANPAHWTNIKIEITISKMKDTYNEKMIGFDFQHAGDFYRKPEPK